MVLSPQVTQADDERKVYLFEKAKGVSQCSPREIAKTSALISG